MRKFKFYAFAVLITGLLFSYGCKKDSDDDNGGGGDNPSGTNYRVKESIDLEDNVETNKDVFTYEGDKLSSVMSYVPQGKTEWETDSKSEVTYPDANSFEIIDSDYSNGNWSLDSKEVVTMANGLWQTDMNYYHNGSDWVSKYKTVYSYNSGKIVKEEEFLFNNGTMENKTKTLYSWVGEVPSDALNYDWEDGNWIPNSKDTLTFSNGKIVELKQFDYETNQYFIKLEIQYVGDAISAMIISVNMGGGVWTNAGTFSFTYDSNGNLTEQEITSSFLPATRVTYSYEEGKGNLSTFMANTGWFNLSLPLKSGSKAPVTFKDLKKLYAPLITK
jgi:hypothetical protein